MVLGGCATAQESRKRDWPQAKNILNAPYVCSCTCLNQIKGTLCTIDDDLRWENWGATYMQGWHLAHQTRQITQICVTHA